MTIGNNTIVKFGKFKFAPNNGGGLLFGKKKEFKHLSDNFSPDHGDKYSTKGKLEGQKIDIWAVEPCYENDQYLLVETCEPETIKGSQGQVFKGTTFIVDKKTGEIVDVKKTIDAAGQQETNTETNDIKNLDDSKKKQEQMLQYFLKQIVMFYLLLKESNLLRARSLALAVCNLLVPLRSTSSGKRAPC